MAGRKRFRAGAWRLTVEGPHKDPITGKRLKINRTVGEPNTKAGAKAAASELARLIVEVDFERRRPSALRDWRRSLVSGSLGLAGSDVRAATPWVGSVLALRARACVGGVSLLAAAHRPTGEPANDASHLRNGLSPGELGRDIVVTADDDGASQEQLWAAVGLFDPDAWASMCARIGATGSAIPTVTNSSSTARRRGSRTNPAMDRTS